MGSQFTSLTPAVKYRQNHYFGFTVSAILPNMENFPVHEPDNVIPLPQEDRGSRQFKGIRLRKSGRWVSEIRMPKSRKKIWLGSYTTPEQAARAYDAAVYCLRGPNAEFNFSVPDIPTASPLSPEQIQHAAAKYALAQASSSLPSFVGHASTWEPCSVSEMELAGDSHPICEERQDFALWWSTLLLAESDGAGIPMEILPSTDGMSASEFLPLGGAGGGEVHVDRSLEFPRRTRKW